MFCQSLDCRKLLAILGDGTGQAASTLLGLLGHVGRRMLVRYPHMRMAGKANTVEALSFAQLA
jgi:hypothetical protein